MSDVVIRVEGLGKQYQIGQRQKHRSLRDALVDTITALPSRFARDQRVSQNGHIWALEDVSFEVKRGEVLGIIGRNGAGKSTLLKILSRITKPTTGCVKICGRVGSLLEVGTGFHPELTGRENIYLNGAVLGMKKTEIERKFEKIVAFAEVDKFLDTPVKRYSSGMYVRLAFAVAAHLEPEILIVDEVLAVGDVAFQKKCLGKMSDVASGGRTVLFVSHNMSAIQRLCPRSLLLEQGWLVAAGPTSDVVNRYLASSAARQEPSSWIDATKLPRRGTAEVHVTSFCFSSRNESYDYHPYSMGPLEITLRISSDTTRSVSSFAVSFSDKHGNKLIDADVLELGQSVMLQEGENTIRLRIEALYLNPDVYYLGWWIGDAVGREFDFVESAAKITVAEQKTKGFGVSSNGIVVCQFDLLEIS